MVINQFDIYLIALDPTKGYEINKTRPCLVISPDSMNHAIRTVIVATMTTKGYQYPTRVPVTFEQKNGYIVLDQLRTVDKGRLVKKLGTIDQETAFCVLQTLQKIFSPIQKQH